MENDKKNKLYSFHIIAITPVGEGLSGGDRIFIELAKQFSKSYSVEIITWEGGVKMCQREELFPSAKLSFTVLPLTSLQKSSFFLCYITRVIKAVLYAFSVSASLIKNSPSTVVYSASDFWMDSVPGYILKKRFSKITWIGSYYLAAPNPFRGFREKGQIKVPSLKDTVYWLMQQPVTWFLKSSADTIFLTSEPDLAQFPEHQKKGRYYIVQGGVDLEKVQKWKEKIGKVEKKYDAVFMGRFHPQKGVLELIDIWGKIVEKKPHAQLIMIGDGPLMPKVKENVKASHLDKNISLPGYVLDGEEKYRYFAQSRVFVHTSVYDSGGMSAAEAMAWEVPAISFDLEALKTYYPKGMLKVPIGDIEAFASTLEKLLSDKKLYEATAQDALKLIQGKWSWEQRAKNILQFLNTYAD